MADFVCSTVKSYPVVDHHTYVLCGDGDLMEGISGSIFSWNIEIRQINRIIRFKLDGPSIVFWRREETFQGLGWNYIRVEDGNDLDESLKLSSTMQKEKPTIIQWKPSLVTVLQTKVQTKFTVLL